MEEKAKEVGKQWESSDGKSASDDTFEDIKGVPILLQISDNSLPSENTISSNLAPKELEPDSYAGEMLEKMQHMVVEAFNDTPGKRSGTVLIKTNPRKESSPFYLNVDTIKENVNTDTLKLRDPQQKVGSRQNSEWQPIPSMPHMSHQSLASSPPFKRSFAAVASPVLASPINPSALFSNMSNDFVHADAYTAQWIGNIQSSEHKPKIITAKAAMRTTHTSPKNSLPNAQIICSGVNNLPGPSCSKASKGVTLKPPLKSSAMSVDVDTNKEQLYIRKKASTKSCQTSDDSELNWNEYDAPTSPSIGQPNVQHLAKVGMFLLELYEHDQQTDVIVKVGSCTFSAHSVILACYSPVLAMIIKSARKPKSWDGKVEIKENITPTAFQVLLDYMYKGELEMACDNFAEVMCAAMELGMAKVKAQCESRLQQMDAASALRILETSHLEKIRVQVKAPMLKIICSGFQQVSESLELQQLCTNCLCDVLTSDQLMVMSEFDVALAALHWLDNDT